MEPVINEIHIPHIVEDPDSNWISGAERTELNEGIERGVGRNVQEVRQGNGWRGVNDEDGLEGGVKTETKGTKINHVYYEKVCQEIKGVAEVLCS